MNIDILKYQINLHREEKDTLNPRTTGLLAGI